MVHCKVYGMKKQVSDYHELFSCTLEKDKAQRFIMGFLEQFLCTSENSKAQEVYNGFPHTPAAKKGKIMRYSYKV